MPKLGVPGWTRSDCSVLKRRIHSSLTRSHGSPMREYQISAPDDQTAAKNLSGGNIQRLVLARELCGSPRFVVAAHPTYGLDVGATEQVRQVLLDQRDQGAGILLISEDLDEIMQLSDRILVIYEGEVMGILSCEEAELEEIGLMMAGSHRREVAL